MRFDTICYIANKEKGMTIVEKYEEFAKRKYREFILENCVGTDGNLHIPALDLSDFDGDVYIGGRLAQDGDSYGRKDGEVSE